MKNKRIKDIMVPLSEYATVSEEDSLRDAVAALKKSQENFDKAKYRHRAILVFNKDNTIVGKVSLLSILRALEPKYDEMLSDKGPAHMGFTRKFQKAMFESLKLWQDPMEHVCRKAAEIKVKAFMTAPNENEMIGPDQELGEAIHQLVIGHHQSLLVTEAGKVIGILRLTDTFEAVAENILACGQ
jgi:CBS domain-containing protein